MRIAAAIARPIIAAATRRTWRGGEHLPRTGGVIVAANHVSGVDPLTVGHFLFDHGAPPRFLAKAELFAVPVLGGLLRAVRQIPVYRGTSRATDALAAARAALADGACVVIYPEGTYTRDPRMWPMTGKTGAARLALETGAPVVPVAQWGPQDVLPRGARLPCVLPRRRVIVVAGPPVHLADLEGRDDAAALREATSRIMAAITAQLAEIRGEEPPERHYDLRRDGDPRVEQKAAKRAVKERRAAARRRRLERLRRLVRLRRLGRLRWLGRLRRALGGRTR